MYRSGRRASGKQDSQGGGNPGEWRTRRVLEVYGSMGGEKTESGKWDSQGGRNPRESIGDGRCTGVGGERTRTRIPKVVRN